ncbi:MAG: DNA polymerase III subunit beta [Deltaproteobacteria bacterium]|nr:DNA polymerase III subunit beta [Deltaproteobacteria bacterium]
MNFTVDRDLLEGLLARVQGVAERRHTMPVLSHTLLTAGGNDLTLVASDLEIVIRCVQGVGATEKGSVALPARKFYDIAKVLPRGPVAVAGREGNYVEISAGRGHFRLAGLPGSEFPEMPEKPKAKPVSVDPEMFRKLVDRIAPFASSDETRYNLAGVLFEKRDVDGKQMLRMVATDGHRLAIADGEVPGIGELLGERRMLVPKKGLLEIRKLAEGGTGSFDLSASEKFLFAGKGDTEIWIRLLEGDFPDYLQVLPKDNALRVKLRRESFTEALRRVSVMAPEKVHSVKLSFSGKQLEVSTTSPDLGEARDLLEVEYDGAPIKIGFNGRYLLDAMNGISEESVLFEIKDEVSQVLIRPEKEASFQAVIMPMRIF